MTKDNLERLVKKYESEAMPRRRIARKLSISRYMVDKILSSKVGQVRQKHSVDAELKTHHPQILEWVYVNNLPIKIIYDRLLQKNVKVSYSTVGRYVSKLDRSEVYVPIMTAPGEQAQLDYGFLGTFNKGNKKIKVWVFNMVLSYSRYAFYKIVTDQSIASFLSCHADAFEFFKGVPTSIKIDNLGAGVLEADFFEPIFQEKYMDFLDHYDTTAITCRIARGQEKGKVEAGIKYVKNNFLKSITHTDFDQLCIDLAKWVKSECNSRLHGTTKKVPKNEYEKDEKSTLKPLPTERYKPIVFEDRKVNNYGHVYFRKNYYSVPSHLSGEIVRVECNGTCVKIYQEDKLMTIHALKQGEGEFATLDNHKPFHKREKSELFFIEQATQIGDNAVKLLKLMQAERPFHWRQMMKGIFALTKAYSHSVIEQACEKAIATTLNTYRSVRSHCAKIMIVPVEKKVYKGINGHAHDLNIYDRLIGAR